MTFEREEVNIHGPALASGDVFLRWVLSSRPPHCSFHLTQLSATAGPLHRPFPCLEQSGASLRPLLKLAALPLAS